MTNLESLAPVVAHSEPLAYLEYLGEDMSDANKPVVIESAWPLTVNGEPWLTILCTPIKLDYFVLLLVLCCVFWVASCTPEHEPEHEYVYRIPEQTNDGWATAGLDDVGMREELLDEMIKRIHSKEYQNIHGILIVKNGKLVFEEYFEGYTFSYSGLWSSALKYRARSYSGR